MKEAGHPLLDIGAASRLELHDRDTKIIVFQDKVEDRGPYGDGATIRVEKAGAEPSNFFLDRAGIYVVMAGLGSILKRIEQ